MEQYTITVTADEFNFIFMSLSELPTKTGAYPLVMKIKEQAEQQTQKSSNLRTISSTPK